MRIIEPLRDRIVVQRIEVEEKVGTLYVPDQAQEKQQEADVLAVGDGKVADNGERVPMRVHVGDRVLFGRFGGLEIKVDGRDYTVLREDEILAILRQA